MESIEFVHKYEFYLDEIQSVIKTEFYPIIDEFRQIDPHDLISPETWFPDEDYAKAFVWMMFMDEVKVFHST